MARTSRWLTCLFVGLGILLADRVSKAWINAASLPESSFVPYQIFSDILGIDLQITHAVNTGAAWGIFSDFPHILVGCRILMILGLILFLVRYNKHPEWQIPLVCIISGAIGNVIDFFYYGYVVDMIQFRFWGYDYPVFNFAVSAIFIGACWLLVPTFSYYPAV